MGVDAFMALFIGRVYDKIGLGALFVVPILSLPIPLLGLSESQLPIYMGIVLWGLSMGAHETIMRAAIADIVPRTRRAFAYGVFNTIYGVSWFIGSSIVGYLYGLYKGYITLFVFITQALAMAVFFYMRAKPKAHL
jgi:MFS family permease